MATDLFKNLDNSIRKVSKKKLLLISFSDSETSFLARVSKNVLLSGDWVCSFLILHPMSESGPVAKDLVANGIKHLIIPENDFYDKYTKEKLYLPHELSNKFKAHRSLRWRMLGRLLELLLFIPWVPLVFVPWVYSAFYRYFRNGLKRKYGRAKQLLRVRFPYLFSRLNRFILSIQFVWGEFPMISEYRLNIKKAAHLRQLKKGILAAERLLQASRPDFLVIAKDSAYYSTIVFVRAAKNQGIPSAVMPYDRADSDTLARDRLDHPNHTIKNHAARETASKYPSWVYSFSGQSLLLSAPEVVCAIEELNLSPPNPWGYNNSCCDRLFLETEEDRQRFISSGLPESQLVVIGAPYMDKIDDLQIQRNELRQEMCNQHNFDIEKPFVVVSVPPNKLSQRATEVEFRSYREIIDKWSSAISQYLNCNLIFSLHPLTNKKEIAFIENRGGLILNHPIEELLALADLYVVDCSGTTRWARYAGVDVIDYDVYKYNLWFNSKIEGVSHVETYEEFETELYKANLRINDLKLFKPNQSDLNSKVRGRYFERLSKEMDDMVLNIKVNNVI